MELRRPTCAWPLGGQGVADRASVEAMLLAAGGLFELRRGEGEAALRSVRAHLDALIADGLPVGADGRLDPADVMNATVAAGRAGRSNFWRTGEVPTGQRLVSSLAGQAGSAPPSLKDLPPRRFDILMRRTFALDRVETAGPRRLRMPLAIQDQHLTGLVVVPEEAASASAMVHPGRLELKTDGKTPGPVTLGAKLSFTAWPQAPAGPAALPQAQRDKWLRDREGVFLLTDKVRALAQRLTHPGGAAQTVRAFQDHLVENLCCGVVPYGSFSTHPLDWVLERGWFDCRLGALLLVALCRACGVPARLVSGVLIWDTPSAHFWMEAWLPDRGWAPIDLLTWDLSAGGADRAWRAVYDDALDYRMKTELLPDIFTGSPGVPFPAAWRRLFRAIPGGAQTTIISADDGAVVYTDEIRIAPAAGTRDGGC